MFRGRDRCLISWRSEVALVVACRHGDLLLERWLRGLAEALDHLGYVEPTQDQPHRSA